MGRLVALWRCGRSLCAPAPAAWPFLEALRGIGGLCVASFIGMRGCHPSILLGPAEPLSKGLCIGAPASLGNMTLLMYNADGWLHEVV